MSIVSQLLTALIRFKRGNLADLPILNQGEPVLTLDEEAFYIGGVNGPIRFPSEKYLASVLREPTESTVLTVNPVLPIDETTFNTIQQAIDYIRDNQGGNYTINIAAGTFSEAITVNRLLNPTDITINGYVNLADEPQTIIEGDTLGIGFYGVGNNVTLRLKNMIINNHKNGIYAENAATIVVDNCKVTDSQNFGIASYQNSIVIVGVTKGCEVTSTSQVNGTIAFHGYLSIEQSLVTGATSYGCYWRSGGYGHCNGNRIENCNFAVAARIGSHPTIEDRGGILCEIDNCSVGLYEELQSSIFQAQSPLINITNTPIKYKTVNHEKQVMTMHLDAVNASETDRPILIGDVDQFIPMPYAGSIVGMAIHQKFNITAGSLSIQPRIFGSTPIGAPIVLDSSNSVFETYFRDLRTFTKNSVIDFVVTTSSDYAPINNSIVLTVWFETVNEIV